MHLRESGLRIGADLKAAAAERELRNALSWRSGKRKAAVLAEGVDHKAVLNFRLRGCRAN